MKIKIEIDCSADEARRFLGMPDISAMQERLVEESETRLRDMVKNMDGKALAELWLPITQKGIHELFGAWSKKWTEYPRNPEKAGGD